MRKFLDKFNNKLLARLITSFLLTSIISTTILMLVVSSFISTSVLNKTTEAQSEVMRHSYTTSYYALTDTYVDFYQLWTKDPAVNNFLNNQDISEESIKAAIRVIDNAVFRDDLVDSVYLINKKADTILSNVDSKKNVDTFHDQSGIYLFNEFEANYTNYKDEIFFPRKTTYDLNGISQSKNYISIVFAIQDLDKKLNSGILVNINQNKLANLLGLSEMDSSIIIVNSKGQIISDSKGLNFASQLERNDIFKKIAGNNKEEDSFVANYLDEKSFITYKKASDIGFVFISITPYSFLNEEVSTINKTVAILFIATMLVSLVVSVISIKKIYEPLNNLIKKIRKTTNLNRVNEGDEYAFLETTFDELIAKNRRSHLFEVFKGNISESINDILMFDKEKYLVVTIIPDKEEDRYSDMLDNLLSLVEKNTGWLGTMTSSESISFVINKDDFSEDVLEAVVEEAIEVLMIISQQLDLTVTSGLGIVVNNLESISTSLRYATIAVNYGLTIGESQVFLYNEIEDIRLAASVNKDNIADEAEKYVLENYHRQDFSVEEVADKLDLSLGYVRQIFKSEKKVTLNEYVITCRIDKAKKLLRESDKTAKDISEAVGYYDNRYFYTFFKKRVGMTTEEYRQSHRKELKWKTII